MSNVNSVQDRAVWFDIPVANLERASKFYASVLNIKVDIINAEGFTFAVLEHSEGIGGCLVQNESENQLQPRHYALFECKWAYPRCCFKSKP